MVNQFSEQTTNDNSNFASHLDFIGQLELTLPESPSVVNSASTEADFDLDDYFMELELDFDE